VGGSPAGLLRRPDVAAVASAWTLRRSFPPPPCRWPLMLHRRARLACAGYVDVPALLPIGRAAVRDLAARQLNCCTAPDRRPGLRIEVRVAGLTTSGLGDRRACSDRGCTTLRRPAARRLHRRTTCGRSWRMRGPLRHRLPDGQCPSHAGGCRGVPAARKRFCGEVRTGGNLAARPERGPAALAFCRRPDHVATCFPSPLIGIGGDECPTVEWTPPSQNLVPPEHPPPPTHIALGHSA